MAWLGFGGALGSLYYYWTQIGSADKTQQTARADLESTITRTLPTQEELRLGSLRAFDRYKEVWDFDDFWKRANVCDACLSLASTLFDRWPEDPEVKRVCQSVEEFLVQNIAYFKKSEIPKMWADDFGWWGLMGINAYQFLKKRGNETLAEEYINLSKSSCWDNIVSIAYDAKTGSKPIAHGSRNNSAKHPNEGVKNTVVNGLLFLLSTRLYRLYSQEGLADRDSFLDMAFRQWVWFSSWFELKEFGYLRTFKNDENAALVLERPTAFFEGSDYRDQSHPTTSPGWVWSGDQGLLVGALLDLLSLQDSLAAYLNSTRPELGFDKNLFESKVKDAIQKLVTGIKKGLIGNCDNVFREPPCSSSLSTYGDDYFEGRGILVRYMGLKEIKALLGIDFTENIFATLNALFSTIDKSTNQFSPEITSEETNLEYYRQFGSLWGSSDQVSGWVFSSSDLKLQDGVCQALGMDFLAASLSLPLKD